MNPRARFIRQLPISAATIFLAGLLLTTGRSTLRRPANRRRQARALVSCLRNI